MSAYAVSRHAATKLVIVQPHKGYKRVAGFDVPQVNKGVQLHFRPIGASPEVEAGRDAKPGAPTGFDCPDLPAFHGKSLARGRLDVKEEALRTGLKQSEVIELLQEHPDNVDNGGSEFVLYADEEESTEKVDVFDRQEDGRVICTLCDQEFAHAGASNLHAMHSKRHKAKLAERAA